MNREERKTLRQLAAQIGEQVRAIAESAEGSKALKTLATIRHALGMYLAQEDLTLPLFPDTKDRADQTDE